MNQYVEAFQGGDINQQFARIKAALAAGKPAAADVEFEIGPRTFETLVDALAYARRVDFDEGEIIIKRNGKSSKLQNFKV
jgi:hypothetical protein